MRFIHRADSRAEAEPETLSEMAVVCDRVSRAVRRTIALQHHLDQAPSRTEKRAAARRQVIRVVEDAIEHRAATADDAERLNAELHDRLDSPELDDEISDRPVDEVIADICHDLGLGNVQELYRQSAGLPPKSPSSARAAQPPRPREESAAAVNGPERFFRIVPSPDGPGPRA